MRWLLLIPVVMFMMSNATMLGMLVDPWAPFRLQAADVRQVDVSGGPQPAVSVDVASIPLIHGGVTDAFRYQLARAAGWNATDAITAVAISIAEDPAGDPAALSPVNTDGSRDYCLLQVNSSWWSRFGGMQALTDPQRCFDAGHTIYTIQLWCAWSTYESSCGHGHTGSYRAYLTRAKAASEVQPPQGQA